MMPETELANLTKCRRATPNVLCLSRPQIEAGAKDYDLAAADLRSIAQNLIDTVAEHRHLKSAMVLLVLERCERTAEKLDQGARVRIGHARKANGLARLLSAGQLVGTDGEQAENPPADWVVTLSEDFLRLAGYRGGEEGGIRKAVALLDHELLHCGARTAGMWVAAADADGVAETLGEDFIEICRDVRDSRDRVLVRHYQRDKDTRNYVWVLRKHDIEEFVGVAGRHGRWSGDISRLVDVVVQGETARS
ncbi:MAG TPA: putative metallopeptidase [Candidatus Omnitrophota bacterium]|nr:putative metallopeptidase [Candidatus Omnitrophota bacterium]